MDETLTEEIETARLKALRDYQILDTAAEEAFDRIAQLASAFYHTPIALISMMEEKRQWFKAAIGAQLEDSPRDIALCNHVIASGRPMLVTDASRDPRFADNPYVTGEACVRFYAGAPLRASGGLAIGTLCIIDNIPRPEFSDQDTGQLQLLADIVVSEMEARLQSKALDKAMRDTMIASKARAEFLSLISHEIRTPLTTIIGLVDQLEQRPQQDAPVQPHMVRSLASASHHLLGMLNDVLDFSKLSAGKLSLNPAPMSLNASMTRIGETWRILAEEKGLIFHVGLSDTLPDTVTLDEQRLVQIINNLLNNAVKFTEHGSVGLQVSRPAPGRLQVVVTDTGPGMSARRLERLFEPFEQGDADVSRTHGGTGLGLSICHRLAGLMEANLDCESKPGEGTRFSLSIPFTDTPDLYTPDLCASDPAGCDPPLTILVVDDMATNCELVSLMLNQPERTIHTALSGKDAIRMAEETDYDVILMDIRMPDMSGFDAGRQILAKGGSVAMIALSADAAEEDVKTAFDLGFADYIQKPVNRERLNTMLRRVTGPTPGRSGNTKAAR